MHLPWVLLGFRISRGEDSEFSPSEAVFGSQLILPGQFLSAPESPSPSFLQDFQGVLASRTPLQTRHHNTPAPTALQRICSCLALCWYAVTLYSRPCRRSTMVRFWFWRGRCIFSRFRSVPGQKSSPHIVSSPVTHQKMRRPTSRPAEVVRRTPPSRQQ